MQCCGQDSLLIYDTVKKNQLYKTEVLTSGFIDIVTNGQVNASARLIRIYLGEPGKFAVPLSIYSGVASGNFANQPPVSSIVRGNEQLFNGLINPLSGLINFSLEDKLTSKRKTTLTSSGFLFHTGFRILTGYKTGVPTDPLTGKPINFLNSFGCGGLFFQTGAWDRSDSENMGIFWLTARYIFSFSSPRSLQPIIPDARSGLYHGWSIGGGVEITDLVNVKIIYYKYAKAPGLNYSLPICQFSFNYSVN